TNLKDHNSFSVAAHCQRLFVLEHLQDLTQLTQIPLHKPLMLGAGTNILFATDHPGDIILNRLEGRQIIDATDKHAYVRIQAGSNWHETVIWSLDQGLSGIENLALIPGTTGAAPIQNIGAYGVELSDTLDLVEVWDRKNQCAVMLKANDCQLSYRDSIFRQQIDRFWILNITLKLSRKPRLHLAYSGLKLKLDEMGITKPCPSDVAAAVCALRQEKLPDPALLANAGSFFKNPIIDDTDLQRLLQDFPELPNWPHGDKSSKISAAWLIEKCGYKGYRKDAAGISDKHALILVNYGQASGVELWQLAKKIQNAVQYKFKLTLQAEPRIINTS
ncbi:MAG: UDP-N-acetylmuramate dehydrogenase, partial [Xanthomonadales bacterium]|nr:UDP-N-acetylmuramate dehydrogenase [Xanthomonadales bacterium]